MKKKDILNEVAGVPMVLESWVNIFTKLIMEKIDTIMDGEWEEEATGEAMIDGEIVEVVATRTIDRYEGDGVFKDIIKHSSESDLNGFLNSKMFNEFPLWKPYIELSVMGAPRTVFLDEQKNYNASFETTPDVKLNNFGKTKVMVGCGFSFGVFVNNETSKLSSEDRSIVIKNLRPVIAHELLHAYQAYKQMVGGNTHVYGKESLLNVVSGNKYIVNGLMPQWNKFLHTVYLHLSFEINARVNALYYEMKEEGVTNMDEFMNVLKKSDVWKEVMLLEDFDANEFIKEFKVPGDDGNDNPFMALSKMVMGMKQKSRGIDITNKDTTLKSLVNVWDTMIITASQIWSEKYGDDFIMKSVPKKAKENPYYFFKFFEQRFHKKAKTFKRKLYKISTLIVRKFI